LADMLSAAAGCPAIERTYVSTPTPPLARLAARSGAVVILERGGGDLNAAFEAARRRIAAAEPQAVVTLLPGDLPRLRAEELQACFEAAGADGVAIAPAAADGG